MKLEWIDECIGDRKSWVLRDLDDGGRPKATINGDYASKFYLFVVAAGLVGCYETVEEAMEIGMAMAPLSAREKRAYKTVINRLN